MLVAMWIVTSLLAAFNLVAGIGKVRTPWPKLSAQMPWTQTTGKGIAYLAAWSEIVGAVGLIVPNVLAHTVPGWQWAAWVSFAAAVGLVIVQVGAAGVHISRKELGVLPTNAVLVILGIVSAVLIASTR